MFNQIAKTMGWPFTIIYLLLIAAAFYFTFITIPQTINSNDWPQVQGEVTNSEIIKRVRTQKTGKRITVYSAKIQYQYIVNNNTFTNEQLKWADKAGSEEIEQAMHQQYPIGNKVTVFYQPDDPSKAVLHKGLSLDHILIGLFLLLSIAGMAFALFRKIRNRPV